MRWILKFIYGYLPDSARFQIVRRFVHVPKTLADEIEFKIATTQEELEAAFRLLHDAYVAQGYTKPHPSGLRVTKYHAMPTTTTLIAKWKGQVIGTLSILRDSPIGLPLDAAFDLSGIRSRYRQIAEVSSLAIHKDFRVQHGAFLWPLLKYFYRYSREFMKLDAIIIGVNPKWADFYLGIMQFRKIQAHTVDNYEFANGNPVVGFYLDLETAPLEYSAVYSNTPSQRNLLEYFSTPELEPNFKMPDRQFHRVADPVMTPELMSYFFAEKSSVLRQLSDADIETLKLAYPDEKYRLVFAAFEAKIRDFRRKDLRYEVNCRAVISEGEGHQITMVTDVSRQGLQVQGPVTREVHLKIQVSQTQIAELKARPVRTTLDGKTGLMITETSPQYENFIDYLERVYEISSASGSSPKVG